MAYKFQYGMVLMVYGGVTFIAPSSKNGRPIYCPSALQYHSTVSIWIRPGIIGFLNTKEPGAVWNNEELTLSDMFDVLNGSKICIINNKVGEPIQKYYTCHEEITSLAYEIENINTVLPVEYIHSIAMHIGN